MGTVASRDNHTILRLRFLPLVTNACCIMPGPGPRCPRRSAQDLQELKLRLRKARRGKPPATAAGARGLRASLPQTESWRTYKTSSEVC